jgi:hypothetical protein
MTREEREQRREHYREKNQRRKDSKRKTTMYAREARELRRTAGGAFGQEDPERFNRLAEGTKAPRKAEAQLEE